MDEVSEFLNAGARNIGARLRTFVAAFAQLVETASDETELLGTGTTLLRGLISEDDWLPEIYAQPDAKYYRQYLLHCDAFERFSVVSFVWGPGQATPVHDHTVWGLVGVLRGAEKVERFSYDAVGVLQKDGPTVLLRAGEVDAVGPCAGDIHRVTNALDDAISVSIHVYGCNIGAVERATYDEGGRTTRFISGYSNTTLPNIWDRSTP